MKSHKPVILSAHQPVYMPWLGLFHKIALSDIFCFFDIVQYQRKDFNNRNKIKTAKEEMWLTVPVKSSNRFNSIISDIEIINNGWKKKHLKSIEINYKKSPYFEKNFHNLKKILDKPYKYLVDLNFDLLIYILDCLNINTRILKASDYSFNGKKSDLVLDMCIQLKADIYIFGEQGKYYADVENFTRNHVYPYFQSYNHPTYEQINGHFKSSMSVIDLIFNKGEESKDIIMSNNIDKKSLIRNALK